MRMLKTKTMVVAVGLAISTGSPVAHAGRLDRKLRRVESKASKDGVVSAREHKEMERLAKRVERRHEKRR